VSAGLPVPADEHTNPHRPAGWSSSADRVVAYVQRAMEPRYSSLVSHGCVLREAFRDVVTLRRTALRGDPHGITDG